jgi:CubicO group peptidase (beta-lactamase class C family)
VKRSRLSTILALFLTLPLMTGSVPIAKPEEAGISSDRLQRIHQPIHPPIDAASIFGAVTLVARRGRLVHLEAHGLMELENKKPMAEDTIFRMASMTEPITGVAIRMLLPEGKLRLTDPVSRFIPEFNVGVPSNGWSGTYTELPSQTCYLERCGAFGVRAPLRQCSLPRVKHFHWLPNHKQLA